MAANTVIDTSAASSPSPSRCISSSTANWGFITKVALKLIVVGGGIFIGLFIGLIIGFATGLIEFRC